MFVGMMLVCLIGMELCMFHHGSLLGPSVLFGTE